MITAKKTTDYKWRNAISSYVKNIVSILESLHKHSGLFTERELDMLRAYLLGESFESIAERTGVSYVTVNSAVRIAKEKLETFMLKYDDVICENERLKKVIAQKDAQIKALSSNARDSKDTGALGISIDDVDIKPKVRNVLKLMGVNTLGDLVTHKKSNLLSVKGITRQSIEILDDILAINGLNFGMDVKAYVEGK